MTSSTPLVVPEHVAIIMDGNRRWARQHSFELLRGHEYVANELIKKLVEHAISRGIKFLTLWAFSTENWHRDQQEVAGIMNLFRQAFQKNAAELHEKGVKLNVIGDLNAFPEDIQENVQHWLQETADNNQITVTFALNYGGRDEIIRAINRWQSSTTRAELTLQDFSKYLDTASLPDPELIIRPGGEKRLSGFLPWQAVYSELYFTEVLMPDFNEVEFDKALEDFASRQRRFGK